MCLGGLGLPGPWDGTPVHRVGVMAYLIACPTFLFFLFFFALGISAKVGRDGGRAGELVSASTGALG
jgi:hypothetical protein